MNSFKSEAYRICSAWLTNEDSIKGVMAKVNYPLVGIMRKNSG